jgi:hypothetical protein
MGAMGLGAMLAALEPSKASAAGLKPRSPMPLSSLSNLKVTRDETFDVPGGKEYFAEWQIADGKGATRKYITHHARVDTDKSYTMSTDVVIHTYDPGASLSGEPSARKEQHITVFAEKGEVMGSVRNDHVTVTIAHTDGSITRESSVSSVKLDNSDLAGMSTRDMIASFGQRFLK